MTTTTAVIDRDAARGRRARRAGSSLAAVIFALAGIAGNGRAEPGTRRETGALGNLVVRADSETSAYADTDHVTVVTPTVGAAVENPVSGWSAGGRYLIDVVTAASVDIVATATRQWREVRHVASADAAYKPGNFGGSASASTSIEPDYVSVSGGGGVSWDVRQKSVTLQLGYGYSHDISGRAGTPFSVFSREIDRHSLNGGVSWIVDRATVATVLGDAVLEYGDTSKPYRYIPMFNPGDAEFVPAGAAINFVNSVRAHERPLEQLPLSRQRFALTGRVARRFAGATLRLDERVYTDTWGLKASTTDLRYLLDVTPRLTAGTHVRLHVQSGADFWRRAYALEPGPGGRLTPPALRTGDRELGPLYTFTAGFSADIDLSRSAGARAWVLKCQAEGIFNHYLDTLYIAQKSAVFAALYVAATFD